MMSQLVNEQEGEATQGVMVTSGGSEQEEGGGMMEGQMVWFSPLFRQ